MMANLNNIEKEQKKIFNDLSIEEKQAYYKKLSEAKYNNYYFLTEEGTLKGNISKYNSIDKAVVDINDNPDLRTLCLNASLSVLADYEALKDKYKEQLVIAFQFYYNSFGYNLTIMDNIIYFLKSFLGVYTEEPSELLYNVLNDVLKETVFTFNEAIVIVNSVLNNLSELAEDKEEKEEILPFKNAIDKKEAKYNDILNKILNLEKPEGVVTDG